MVYRVAEVGKEDIVDRRGLWDGQYIYVAPFWISPGRYLSIYCWCLSQTGYIRIAKNAPTAKSITTHVRRFKFPSQKLDAHRVIPPTPAFGLCLPGSLCVAADDFDLVGLN